MWTAWGCRPEKVKRRHSTVYHILYCIQYTQRGKNHVLELLKKFDYCMFFFSLNRGKGLAISKVVSFGLN